MIALENASVRIGGTTALDRFTGEFPPGAVTALVGGDGAGKSTLLRVLAGRQPASPPPRGLVRDPRRIGYQPAEAGVWSNLSVDENVRFVSGVHGLSGGPARERADSLLHRAGLNRARGRLAGRLSGGMRQKLAFVLATLHRPELVLLDEPTTGVDPLSRGELWSLVAEAAADGAAVVLATTYLDEAERAERLFLLDEGRLLASGAPEEVVSGMPGRLLRGAASAAELNAPDSRRAWRRGADVFLWTPTEAEEAPTGFAPASPDLENAVIARILADEQAETAPEVPSFSPAASAGGASTEARPAAGGRAADPLVRAEGLERVYGDFAALNGVSLAVSRGEIVGLLGGNGAGKTTLMRMILGLETPTSGACLLFGERPSLASRRRTGYVAQGHGLYPSLSALENLRFAAAVHGAAVGEQAADFARALGPGPAAALPLGARRMLAYLAASQHRPELLILDEPTSGMDALTRARLWKALRETADEGTAILVTTHYMQEAAQCDRLVVLSAGVVAAEGTAAEITAHRSSLVLRTDHWEDAFRRLREAGVPVILDGRSLRLPGVARSRAESVLAGLPGPMRLEERRSTLEESMLPGAD